MKQLIEIKPDIVLEVKYQLPYSAELTLILPDEPSLYYLIASQWAQGYSWGKFYRKEIAQSSSELLERVNSSIAELKGILSWEDIGKEFVECEGVESCNPFDEINIFSYKFLGIPISPKTLIFFTTPTFDQEPKGWRYFDILKSFFSFKCDPPIELVPDITDAIKFLTKLGIEIKSIKDFYCIKQSGFYLFSSRSPVVYKDESWTVSILTAGVSLTEDWNDIFVKLAVSNGVIMEVID